MSDIFREVDEEVRRSKAEAMWAKYSGLVFAACTLLVLSVAGYRFYEWQREKAAAAEGAKFDAALQLLQSGKTTEGEAAISRIAAEGPGIYKSLAQFRAAAELARRDASGAMKAYDALVDDVALDTGLRDLARIRASAIAVDILPLADVERRMTPLLAASSAWRFTARELLAAAALKANDLGKARSYLDAIILAREAPAAVKSRAEILIGLTRGAK